MLLWIIFVGAHAARVQIDQSSQKLALKLKRPKILQFLIVVFIVR